MPLLSPDPLYEQLCALRDADNPTDPCHGGRWRIVSDWLARAFPGGGSEGEDARQEAMISLVRNVGRMQAEAPLQCAKWVSTILKRKRIDALRVTANDPVRQGLKREPGHADSTPLVERLQSESQPSLTPAALESLVTLVLGHVHRAIDDSTRSASKRLLRRAQAQATLLRLVVEWDAEAIAEALDYGEPVGKERIYKWVERGRAPVRMGLERWAQTAEGEEIVIIEVLRELTDERRADAGQPRPDRRKDRAGESP